MSPLTIRLAFSILSSHVFTTSCSSLLFQLSSHAVPACCLDSRRCTALASPEGRPTRPSDPARPTHHRLPTPQRAESVLTVHRWPPAFWRSSRRPRSPLHQDRHL